MEEDNTQYFNDEWNLTKDQLLIKKYQYFYDIIYQRLDHLMTREFMNNYKQLSCQCYLPRPNSFTGNCLNCNLIIKPIIDKDVN